MHKTCSEQAADTLGKVVLLRRLKLYAQNPHILFMYICSCNSYVYVKCERMTTVFNHFYKVSNLYMHMNCKKPYKKADGIIAAYICA